MISIINQYTSEDKHRLALEHSSLVLRINYNSLEVLKKGNTRTPDTDIIKWLGKAIMESIKAGRGFEDSFCRVFDCFLPNITEPEPRESKADNVPPRVVYIFDDNATPMPDEEIRRNLRAQRDNPAIRAVLALLRQHMAEVVSTVSSPNALNRDHGCGQSYALALLASELADLTATDVS